MHRKNSLSVVILCLLITGMVICNHRPDISVNAARNSSHTVPSWDLTVGNSTQNTTYSLTELLHMPFYSFNGTSGGGSPETGHWGGVLVRDLITPYIGGAWEFVVQVEAGAYKVNMTYEDATRNDSLIAFWLESDWLDPATHGITRQATLSNNTGSAWTKNVTALRVIPTNTTIIPREWTLKIDAYRDAELSWGQIIHHGYREMKYGWYKDPPMEFGTYIGQSVKSFLSAYVGPWTEYDVTVIAIDGFTKYWEWDEIVQNDTWFIAYGENGSQFMDLSTTGWVRLVALNDSSAKGGQRSAKNVSEIVVHPKTVKPEYSSNLTLLDEGGGQIAFYDPLNLTSLPYLEGPVRVYGGEGAVERGMYMLKGVNFTALMESHFPLTDDITISTLGKDGWSVNLSISEIANNATHTTILAWEVDGRTTDLTYLDLERTLMFGTVVNDASAVGASIDPTWQVLTLTFYGLNVTPAGPTTPTSPTTPTNGTPWFVDPLILLLLGGNVGQTIIIVGLLVYMRRRSQEGFIY